MKYRTEKAEQSLQELPTELLQNNGIPVLVYVPVAFENRVVVDWAAFASLDALGFPHAANPQLCYTTHNDLANSQPPLVPPLPPCIISTFAFISQY